MQMALGNQQRHYDRLGLTEGVINVMEDGLRTNAAQGSFEWWYLDCHLDDGSKLIITFYTKPPNVAASRPLMPFVSFLLDRPDGTHVERAFLASPESFAASREQCDVRVGNNTFVGDLKSYKVHVEIDDVMADVELVSDFAPFRPATGHIFFGEKEELFVGWFPAVPKGRAHASLRVGDETMALSGTAYHDHNWGNTSLRKIVDHWYWARACCGDYTVLALMFVAAKSYGGEVITSFMLGKGGEMIAANENKLEFVAGERSPHSETGILVNNHLSYRFQHNDDQFAVTFRRKQNLYTVDFAPGGAYMRFGGDVVLERRVGSVPKEKIDGDAVWELLYFGERSNS